ncbi:NUMOD4 domain-containing protein, partial [Enterococcus faecalis]
MKLENFKVIPEYPEYLISPYGEVYSTKSNKLLTHHLGSAG